jgi:hypothetical protein
MLARSLSLKPPRTHQLHQQLLLLERSLRMLLPKRNGTRNLLALMIR